MLVRKVTRARPLTLAACVFAASSGCRPGPGQAEGTRRLTGEYVLRDERPAAPRNPNYRTGTLRLNADGTGVQRCTFQDGTFETPLTWKYDGEGSVSLSPFKDCSWVWSTMGRREGALDKPAHGASLIVEWGSKPSIVIDPDLNPTYDWVGPIAK